VCGRYALTSTADDLARVLPGLDVPASLAPRWNVAPTQDAAVVPNDGQRRVVLFRWGLVPSWAKDRSVGSRMINARAETLAEKPSFRQALSRRRCLVLADAFYEWKKEADGSKTPTAIRRVDSRPFALAGLWESWRDPESPSDEPLRTFTIVTGPPNELVATIHDRMPVILAAPAAEAWIAPEPRTAQELLPLLVPAPAADFRAHAVSRAVNDARHDAPDCLEPA
jgi:putative SOS response-associated peptidase YedK